MFIVWESIGWLWPIASLEFKATVHFDNMKIVVALKICCECRACIWCSVQVSHAHNIAWVTQKKKTKKKEKTHINSNLYIATSIVWSHSCCASWLYVSSCGNRNDITVWPRNATQRKWKISVSRSKGKEVTKQIQHVVSHALSHTHTYSLANSHSQEYLCCTHIFSILARNLDLASAYPTFDT